MGKGKAARERRFADLALLFASLTPARRKEADGALRATPIDENRPISGRTPLEKWHTLPRERTQDEGLFVPALSWGAGSPPFSSTKTLSSLAIGFLWL